MHLCRLQLVNGVLYIQSIHHRHYMYSDMHWTATVQDPNYVLPGDITHLTGVCELEDVLGLGAWGGIPAVHQQQATT